MSLVVFEDSTMKIILIFIFVISFISSNADGDKQIEDECRKSSGWTGNFRDKNITRERKCFEDCLFKKIGMMKIDGSLDKSKTLELFKNNIRGEKLFAKVKELIEKCFEEIKPESDSCETASKLSICLKKTKLAK